MRGRHETAEMQRDKSREYWGNKLKKKEPGTVRLLLNNMNGIGAYRGGIKDESLRQFIKSNDVDIVCLTEPNVNWGKVKKKDNWYDRTGSWFESRRLAVAYNKTRGRLARRDQYGGTMTMAVDKISHRAVQSGYDYSGLGRWSYIRFKGKRSNVSRVITAYCPCRSKTGIHTVYSQQLRVLKRDPIQAFWDDLERQVKEWQLAGETILLSGDWNVDSQDRAFCAWKKRLGLIDPIETRHGTDSPGTFNKGNRRLDSFLVSAYLQYDKCGFLPFGMLSGDHRGIYLDVKMNSFIGYRAPPVPSHKARRLQLQDPRILARYQEVLDSILEKEQIYRQVLQLESTIQRTGFTPSVERQYEKIASIHDKAMATAERKCRKLRMGGREWSPILQHARDEILLWTLVKRRLLGRLVGAKRIVRLKKKLHIQDTNISLEASSVHLDLAYKEYKSVRKKDSHLRRTFLEDLALARAEAGNTSQATELRNQGIRERQRTTSRHIRQVIGKGKSQGTSKIEMLLADGTVKEITQPKEMEKCLLQQNRSTFNQNGDCPLLQDQLLTDLGLLGDGPEVINVLNGTYDPPEGTSAATILWLKQMAISHPFARCEISTSLKSYRQGWKLAKERTATGNLHVGHFKAGALHKKLGWLNFMMAVLPYTAGYVPLRWRKGTDVMLLKKEECYLVTKLRTIVLYEADFNAENKRLGKDAMKLAIKNNGIAAEQFSRPGRSAQENAVCKRLVFDYARTTRRPYGMCACDLKSCYDRIVHTAASIALQRIGVPIGKIKGMFGAVQKLVHHVRTLFGTSVDTYGGPDDDTFGLPPQGMGQGHGAGPTIWSVLSSTVFEVLHKEGYASSFIFAISKGLFHLCGFSYVDDCDLLCFGDGNDINIVFSRMQSMLTLWDELMEVNGGAIAPDKCWWYLIDFKWRNGMWKAVDVGDSLQLQARDKDKITRNLTYLHGKTAKEMLGVFLSPDGNDSQQLEVLVSKAKKWIDFVRVGGLDWGSTWVALKTTIMKSLEYPLPATIFTKQQISSITGPLYNTALPRSGFARSFPRDVLHGPVSCQGLGLDWLYDKQFVRHIKDILDFKHKQATSSDILQLAVESIKVELGIQGPLFMSKYAPDYITTTNSWVAATKKYCLEHDIQFDEKCGDLGIKRIGDTMLMEAFIDSGYAIADLKAINRCRIFSRVSTLSDITTGDGKYLTNFALKGHIHAVDNYSWPLQSRPPPRDWKVWRRLLRQTFAPRFNLLDIPLQDWSISDEETYFTTWTWWTDDSGHLFKFADNTWSQLHPVAESRYRTRFAQSRYLSELTETPTPLPSRPPNIYRTSVDGTGSKLLLTRGFQPVHSTITWTSDPVIPTLDTIFRSIDDPWLTQYLDIRCSMQVLVRHLVAGNVVCVSDGSFHPQRRTGSMAWCLATTSGTILIEGGGLIPGESDTQCSYRSEAGGLLGIVTIISILENLLVERPESYTLPVACDGESALYRSLIGGREKLNSSAKHCDLISRIHDRKDTLMADILPIHVYGHRDDFADNLTVLEKLNVRMDKIAKRIANTCRDASIFSMPGMPSSRDGLPTVTCSGVVISSEIERSLLDTVGEIRLKKWWIKKGRFSEVQVDLIDWQCMKRTMSSCGYQLKRFIPKWTTRQLAVGTTMAYRDARAHNDCPRCACDTEDTLHVLTCQQQEARALWQSQVTSIIDWCVKVDTMEPLVTVISEVLLDWQNGSLQNHSIRQEWPIEVSSACRQQSLLGWQAFMEGILSRNWAILQQSHYANKGSRRLGSKWVGDLSVRIWKAIFAMWGHRNDVLHKSGAISEFSGSRELFLACNRELDMGSRGLEDIYHHFFDIGKAEFKKETIDYKRNWFSIVRQAREDTGHIYSDFFAVSSSSRQWAGLDSIPVSRD